MCLLQGCTIKCSRPISQNQNGCLRRPMLSTKEHHKSRMDPWITTWLRIIIQSLNILSPNRACKLPFMRLTKAKLLIAGSGVNQCCSSVFSCQLHRLNLPDDKKKDLEIGGGLLMGIGAIAAGYYAYHEYKKTEEEVS